MGSTTAGRLILVATIVVTGLFSTSLRAGHDNLTDLAKKAYKDGFSYGKVADAPGDFAKQQQKYAFNLVFKVLKDKMDKPYDDILPRSYVGLSVEHEKESLPLVFSSSDEKLRKFVTELPPAQLVTVYCRLRSKNYHDKKQGGSTKRYYLAVDDVDIFEHKKENIESFDAKNFKEVSFRRLEIQHAQYSGKKIRLNLRFKDIGTKIPRFLTPRYGISPETHFTLETNDQFRILMVADRNNENCIVPLEDITPGKKLIVCGELREYIPDAKEHAKPYYFIYVYGLLTD